MGISPSSASRIASVLTKSLRVSIASGNMWAYNFKDKTIYYRERDLASLTEDDVIANLLHESGHAKFSRAYSLILRARVPNEDHFKKLHLITNVIEDFRIEDCLRGEYPFAKDFLPDYSFKTLFELNRWGEKFRPSPTIPKYLQYCVGIYTKLANATPGIPIDRDVEKVIEQTTAAAERARLETKGTQELFDIIQKDIYPKIIPFLDEFPVPPGRMFVATPVEGHAFPPYPRDLYEQIKPLIPATIRAFNKVLTDAKFDKVAGKYRSGPYLNTRKLYKFATGDIKLVQRRVEAKTKNYLFALVVDVSGSMHDDKIESAIKAAMLFASVLDSLGIPYSLHSFNAEICHYKKASENIKISTSPIFEEMFREAYSERAGYNNDGLALNEVSARMLKVSDKERKVLFMMTDGLPAEIGRGLDYPLPAEVKNTIKKGIEPVGVGIGRDQDVKSYYPTAVVAERVDSLPQVLLSALKDKLK